MTIYRVESMIAVACVTSEAGQAWRGVSCSDERHLWTGCAIAQRGMERMRRVFVSPAEYAVH